MTPTLFGSQQGSTVEESESEHRIHFGFLHAMGTGRRIQYLAALAANMGALAFGIVLSYPAVALPSLREDPDFRGITTNEQSWIGSIVSLGAVAAGPLGGFAVEKFGRRKSMLILSVPFALAWMLIYTAQNFAMILAGRLFTGMFAGTFAVIAPIFTAEVSDSEIRGLLGASFDLMISVGILFIYIVGGLVSWRTQALISISVPVLIFFLLLLVPESPTYLVKVGKFEEARKALSRYKADGAHNELELLTGNVAKNQNEIGFGSVKNVFTRPILVPVSIVFMIYMFQVISGLDPILIYTVDIFHSTGTGLNEYMSTIIIGGMQIMAGIVAVLIVEKTGRRFLLMLSEGAMVLALSSFGLYFYLKSQNGGTQPAGMDWLPLLSLTTYVVSYSVGLGPVGYLIMGELLPLRIKGFAGSALTSIKWLMSFVVTMLFQLIIESWGDAVCYWLFASFCLTGFVAILFLVPETKGKSLVEIQQIFNLQEESCILQAKESSPLENKSRNSYQSI